jgi:HSP20 family protein
MALIRREHPLFDFPDVWRRFAEGDLGSGWLRVEEVRDGNDIVVRSELPGIDPERDVELTVEDGVLHIEARREERSESKDKNVYRSEFRYGSFSRNVALPAGVKEDDIKASYKDGILEVRIPVGDEVKSAATKIPVTRG